LGHYRTEIDIYFDHALTQVRKSQQEIPVVQVRRQIGVFERIHGICFHRAHECPDYFRVSPEKEPHGVHKQRDKIVDLYVWVDYFSDGRLGVVSRPDYQVKNKG
jgi:hypothetical protein